MYVSLGIYLPTHQHIYLSMYIPTIADKYILICLNQTELGALIPELEAVPDGPNEVVDRERECVVCLARGGKCCGPGDVAAV